ncbi:MAG: DUF58 domain-containing protein [Pseudomonadota bacterium]
MWRISYRLLRAASGVQYRLMRRFTPAGLFLGGCAVFAAALGVDTSQTLAYQIFTLLLALGVVAVASIAVLRVPVSAERNLPRTVAAGETFSYSVRVRNLSDAPLAGLDLIERTSDPRPTLAEFRSELRFPSYQGFSRLARARQVGTLEEAHLDRLAARGEAEVKITGRTWRRGVLHFEAITVARADPLGLARAQRTIAQPANVVVLPRRYPVPPLALPGTRTFQPGGVSNAVSVGDAEEFIGLREYRPGDPLHRIHWKSFARLGEPIVREFQDEFFERYALALDTFGEARQALLFEEAVSVAASFIYTIDTQECLLDLLFVGEQPYCYTGGRGQMQPLGLLEVLAGARLAGGSIARLRNALLARRSQLSGCILILIAWDDARRALVRELHRLGLPARVLLVCDAAPAGLPPSVHALVPGKIAEGLAKL